MDVGVIGTGMMGRNHVRVYSELKDVDSLYVFDLNQESCREVADPFDAIPCTSAVQLLDASDAVSVCVPTRFHHEVAAKAIAAGVHTLVEKPLCATAADAARLIEDIPRGVTVGVGHIERFNPIVKEISRLAKRPLYIELKRHNPTSSRITDTSVIEDLMIHDVDILRHVLMGEGYSLSSGGTRDVVSALFRFGTTPAYLSASRKASKKVRMIYIEEEDLTIEGDFMTQEVYVYRKPENYRMDNERYVQENIIEKLLVNKVEPLKVELKAFLDCAKTGSAFPVSPAQAVENLRICEEIRALCGAWG